MTDPNARLRGALADLHRARTPAGRRRLGSFLIEGTRLHERALRCGAVPDTVVASRSYVGSDDPRIRRLIADLGAACCEVLVADEADVAELTGGRSTGAVLGLVRFPRPASLDSLLECRSSERRTVLVVCAEVEDPGNVGALARTALAGGAAGLIAVGISDPYHPRAVRVSMGSVLKLPILRLEEPGALLDALDAKGVTKLGAVAEGGQDLRELPTSPGPVALLLGREAFGLGGAWRRRVDATVSVPMAPGVDSYSVNAAAAVLLYELVWPRP